MKARLKIYALQGLLACDGVPMPGSALLAHLQNAHRPHRASQIECEHALAELETEGWVAVIHDELTGEATFTLTAKGQHKAMQL